MSFVCHLFASVFMNFFLLPAYIGDICVPNPCMNGGICQLQGVLGFTCQCRPGFQGLTCQICKYCIAFIPVLNSSCLCN